MEIRFLLGPRVITPSHASGSGGEMADARDFLPEAGPPLAEKSPSDTPSMELHAKPAAYVISGDHGFYLYKGSTRNMASRWAQHAAGRVARTRSRHPLKLVYVEYFDQYTDARRRELFFKTGAGRAFIKAQVAKWQTQGT